MKNQLSLQEFTRDYSELMTVDMNGKFTRKALELKLIGSQFSAIVEVYMHAEHALACAYYIYMHISI